MAKPILMPQVGQDLTEGKLIEWRVKVGDIVAKGDIVAVVESEKASFDVEAFEAGTVLRLLYDAGATTEVLAPLAFVGEPGEASSAIPASAVAMPAFEPTLPAAQALALSSKTPERRGPSSKANGAPRSSPLARRLALDNGLDLAVLAGSGPNWAIIKHDIETALASRKNSPAAGNPPTTRRVAPTPSDARLHRVWLRKGAGDPIVFIHGFGADLNAWRGIVGAAAISRPILGIDLPGHGRSPVAGEIVWPDIVEAVAATLREERVEAADLVGHSLGAAVAIGVAETARFAVRSLFLIAPAGLGPDINGAFLAGFLRAETAASLAPWMLLLATDENVIGPAFVAVTAQTRAEAGVMAGQSQVAQALFPNGTQAFSVRKAVAALHCPVRIVFGAEDRIIPADHAAGLPGPIAVHRFPGIGHMPHIEARDAVARLLREHLQSVL
jgi:pimeloyl-ACP methyl ester carboxylesterase